MSIRLGVAAMDRKARSKPMRNILSRLLATNRFEIVIFGDKVILDESIETWPVVDFLITFFSSGFPMDKAIEYVRSCDSFDLAEQLGQVNLCKPICINDLPYQKIFWDRRIVAMVLDAIGVRTPEKIQVCRDEGPTLDPKVAQILEREFGIKANAPQKRTELIMKGDTITVGNSSLNKSFVEKPVNGEDHNVYIYFSKRRGGGGRRLFRKIGNKSSELDANLTTPRTEGSFIYEKFMDVENAEDVKVYTIGPNYAHAETRKSPVVDGVVRRNEDGKEIRYKIELTAEEKRMASDISKAFKQNVCGFDLIRANGKSYVIDVNGWSFVKGSDDYYNKCAEILLHFCCQQPTPKTPIAPPPTPAKDTWRVHSVVTVFRHADRTPKMKLKYAFKCVEPWTQPFVDLLQTRTDEIILRQPEQLQYVSNAAAAALEIEGCDADKLHSLRRIIASKIDSTGTKIQLKPSFAADGSCEKIQVIVKWGGEFTHAARYQCRDLGENMRKDLLIMNKSILANTSIYSSSERRCIATAETFGAALLDDSSAGTPNMQHPLIIRKDLLDDSNAAKMDDVKKQLKHLLRPGEHLKRPEFVWPVPEEEPVSVVANLIDLMRYHRELLASNWKVLDVNAIQSRWCCGEWPELFRERWDKLFNEFCDIEPEKFDPSKISELYDSLKYDALHNRVFLETIFRPASNSGLHLAASTNSLSETALASPPKLKQLYNAAKELFDFIAPQEYGIERQEKEEIGLLTSLPLLSQIIENLQAATQTDIGTGSFYITKESHIQTLANLVIFSQLQIVMPRLPELDYMSYITFEVYERFKNDEKQFSVRISLSEGAHAFPLDVSLDAKHALSVQQRRILTNHIALPECIEKLSRHKEFSELIKKSTTPYEGFLSALPVEGDEVYGGLADAVVQYRSFTGATKSRPESVASNSNRPSRASSNGGDVSS